MGTNDFSPRLIFIRINQLQFHEQAVGTIVQLDIDFVPPGVIRGQFEPVFIGLCPELYAVRVLAAYIPAQRTLYSVRGKVFNGPISG